MTQHRESLICQHVRRIEVLREKQKAAAAPITEAVRTARDDGVDMWALRIALRLREMDSIKAQAALSNINTYAEELGILDQTDTFR